MPTTYQIMTKTSEMLTVEADDVEIVAMDGAGGFLQLSAGVDLDAQMVLLLPVSNLEWVRVRPASTPAPA